MAKLLSQQDDYKNQVLMLEILIKESGHEINFLPKCHCELNLIEMISSIFSPPHNFLRPCENLGKPMHHGQNLKKNHFLMSFYLACQGF